ncbi:bifunctional DNA-formamidopyrimidine glycosylase/DNA-(apurinic or apyrimidinic site) lyase [Motiliproteus sp. MSK22-1]|uniref:bifunctional DNA-formamidopyrimidine glycosylase/DNA-(apurinic or apyrimidinic site) lyase n=1 Tax=Motiliproteus sp. MSK22-1 TaxID=1897630 RepID=UPI000976521B|nr:bifunctional DNA-formamidopyrimidine glycosylase/DNA-(apurinic or apyrimidinic site) lyase [Motiliproteus sp. MSK22-1]OMH39436.1 DNA-formamidopyrimidine glycosylase [Motiliproteus sp. MSK22-1]
MPELPEVETTRRGIEPHILGAQVLSVVVRQPKLRWPVPEELGQVLLGLEVLAVERRAKYLLVRTELGTLLLHLGMSGSLRLVEAGELPGKHDHLDLGFDNGKILRFCDPRRFGAVLWTDGGVDQHPLLINLGPEPLQPEFDDDRLFSLSRGKKQPVKTFVMDNKVVVGVGNIYANEALFEAGIDPRREAGKISKRRYLLLTSIIKKVLARAIQQGGTTLKDFVGGDGKPGYFQQELQVYGRGGESCKICQSILKEVRIGQRNTVFCPKCQR